MWPDFPPVWWCTGWKHIRHCSTTCQTRPGKDPTFFPASIGECDPSTRLTQVLPRRRHQQKNLGPFSGKDAPTPLSLPSPRHLLTQLKSKNVPSGTSKVGNDNKSFVCSIAGGVGFNYKTHTRETTASRTHMCDVYCWLVVVPFPFEKEKKNRSSEKLNFRSVDYLWLCSSGKCGLMEKQTQLHLASILRREIEREDVHSSSTPAPSPRTLKLID